MNTAIQLLEKDFTKNKDGVFVFEIPSSTLGDVSIYMTDVYESNFYHIKRILTENGNTNLYVKKDVSATIVVEGNANGDLYRDGGNGHTMLKGNGNGNVTVKNIIHGTSIRSGDGNGNADVISEDSHNTTAIKFGAGIGSAINNCCRGFAFREDLGVGNSELYGIDGISYHGPFDEKIFENLLTMVRNPLEEIGNKKFTMPKTDGELEEYDNMIFKITDHEGYSHILERYENQWEVASVKDYTNGGNGNAIMTYVLRKLDGSSRFVEGGAIRFGGGKGDSIYNTDNYIDNQHFSREGMSVRFGTGKGDALGDSGWRCKGGPGFGKSTGDVTSWMKSYGCKESKMNKRMSEKRKQIEMTNKNIKSNSGRGV